MRVNGIYKLVKALLLKVQGLSRTQAIITAVTGAVAVGGVGTGGYLIYDHNNQPKQVVADVALNNTEDVLTETEELDNLIADTELLALESVAVTEETEVAEPEIKQLSLVGTSMEKDLKIKVQDQKSKVVAGEQFEVLVKSDQRNAKATTYTDDDKDGIIYIDKLDAGNYTVDLKAVEGYEIKKGSITVAVKDQLEYKKVDVTAEIKTEKDVNASVEDTAVNNVPVESTLTDTVTLLPSDVTTTMVEKSAVDQSNFTIASADGEMVSVILKKSAATPPTGTTENPDTGTQQPGTTDPSTQQPATTNPGAPTQGTQQQTPPNSGAQQPAVPGTQQTAPATPDSGAATQGTTQTASVERNRVSRVAAAADSALVATVSLPKQIVLYNCDNPASTSYNLSLAVAGDATIIQSVQWGTTNSDVVALSEASGNSIIVSKGTNSGTREANVGATITYYKDDKGNTATATLQTTVKVVNLTDSSTALKDKSGNVLYTDPGAKKAATLKDYNTSSQFYTTPQYTGWQTIDGKVYYYNADHTPITGNQVIGGVTYTFSADGSLAQSSGSRGIDVSKWQGDIDWGAVASSGISFAIIRAGYRGASTGALIEDPYFRKNIAGATRAGIKVGVYFFTQAITEAEAIEEASMTLSLVSGYNLSYPIFIDTESASNGRANGLDKGTRTAVVDAFCRTIANAGQRPGIYASKNWYNNNLNAPALSNYCIWVAQYNATCTYSGKYNIWQYSSAGSVPGIKGRVDMNISYM